MNTRPNIVLVHGAWADGSCWSGVIERLQADGYHVTAPQFPLTGLADDVARLRQVLELQDGPTVVAGHSYGGQVITALGADAPNVAGLVYVAAFGLDQGESLGALLSQGPVTPALAHLFTDTRGFAWLSEDDFVSHFAGDVDPVKATVMYAVQQPLAASAFGEVMGVPAWKALPSWYLVATDDQAIPPDAERQFAARMGATTVEIPGGYDALRLVDIPGPQPRAGQTLVRVTSAGVTPLDRTVLAGLHPSARKPPLVPGNEGAGVVIEDPSGRFSSGERVLFFAGPGGVAQDGTFPEMTSVPSGNLAPLPGEIPDEIASGLPVAYLSAFLALRQAGFREGQSVLAPGAGGSVGNATLKLARALGASRLVSTAGSAAKEAAAAADGGLRQVGIVNLQRESLADGLARLAPGGIDIVIDALGGPLTGQAVGGLARGGRVVVLGYAAGTETTMRVTDLVWKLAHLSGFSLFAASAAEQAEAYTTVLPLIASGQIAPAHDRSFPLEQAPEALRHLIEDRPFGTVTLTVDALSVCTCGLCLRRAALLRYVRGDPHVLVHRY